MQFLITSLFNFTILITAFIGLVRYRQISPVFRPFLFLTWIGAFNEVMGQVLVANGYYNIYNFNAYQFIEGVLIVWQFQKWGLYANQKIYPWLYGAVLSGYLADNLFLSGFHRFNSYFRIYGAVLVVLLAIHMINKLIISERSNLLRHPVFLICCGFLLFFTFSILTEVFWLYGTSLSGSFRSGLNGIVSWSNLFCNLTFALAVLWMPSRQVFSLPY